MIISEDLLLNHGAFYEYYDTNQPLFSEGSMPKYYYQIVRGVVELNNYHEDGKEFTQHIFFDGQSIGESFLFGDLPYNVTAIAKSKCKVLQIVKSEFLKILEANSDVSLSLFSHIANRLSDKYFMLFTLISQDPATRIESVLNYLKKDFTEVRPFSFRVPLTRQQLANLTGLRVETVIRTVKKMEHENKIKIENRAIYY